MSKLDQKLCGHILSRISAQNNVDLPRIRAVRPFNEMLSLMLFEARGSTICERGAQNVASSLQLFWQFNVKVLILSQFACLMQLMTKQRAAGCCRKSRPTKLCAKTDECRSLFDPCMVSNRQLSQNTKDAALKGVSPRVRGGE